MKGKYNFFIFDLDGTIYVDGIAIGNIISQLNQLNYEECTILFLTNNTSVDKKEYIDKLNKLGLDFVTIKNILTPIDIFLSFANDQKINTCFYLLPDKVVEDIHLLGGPKFNDINPEIVLIGFDKELTYYKTQKACELINKNIPYYITHIDYACPSSLGPIPDCGAIASMVLQTTEKKWVDNFGKPGDLMSEAILKLIKSKDLESISAVLVGDRYYTDIKLGRLINIDTVHVNTGEQNKFPEKDSHPTFEFLDVSKFIEWQYIIK
jgi:HAD superfamily hydrolase (TIGR01450 family)